MTHKTFQARLHGPKTKRTYKIDRHDREENSKREGVLNTERPRTGQLAVPWLLRASAGRTRWPNPETRCFPRSVWHTLRPCGCMVCAACLAEWLEHGEVGEGAATSGGRSPASVILEDELHLAERPCPCCTRARSMGAPSRAGRRASSCRA